MQLLGAPGVPGDRFRDEIEPSLRLSESERPEPGVCKGTIVEAQT